jgi:hypothetical protein
VICAPRFFLYLLPFPLISFPFPSLPNVVVSSGLNVKDIKATSTDAP